MENRDWASDCCGQRPLYPVDDYTKGVVIGICGWCRDHSTFKKIKENEDE